MRRAPVTVSSHRNQIDIGPAIKRPVEGEREKRSGPLSVELTFRFRIHLAANWTSRPGADLGIQSK